MHRLLSPRSWWKLPSLWDRLVAYCEGGWKALAVLLDGHTGQRRRKPLRPVFEMLETRYAPATRIWDGGGTTNNWSDADNWDGNTAIASGDVLVFDDTGVGVRSTSNNDLTSFSVAQIQLTNTTGAYSLTGNGVTVTSAIAADLPTGISGTIGLALNGAATFTKSSAGTIVLTAANGYTGATTVSGGVMQVGAGSTTGSLASSSAISISSGAQFTFYRGNTSELSFANSLSGAGTFEAKGPGTSLAGQYVLSGSNSGFSGSLVVTAARIRSGGASNFGSSSITVNSGGQIYAVNGATFTQSLTLNGVGWVESAGTLGALRIEGNATWSGAIALGGNARIGAYGGQTGNVTGAISGSYELELWAGGTGGGTLNLTPGSSPSYSSTRISGSAAVVAGNASALSTGGLVMNGGTLRLNGNNLSFANLQGSSGAIRNNSASSSATITVGGDDSSTTFSGTFADGSSQFLAVTKIGSGVLTLAGANSHTGVTTISAGTIKAGNGSALGSVTGGTTVTSGATLDIGGQNLGSEIVSIAGTGVGGDGAVVNSGSQQANALRFLTLTGDASIGGSNRWDVRGAGSQVDLTSYKLTKLGSNTVAFVNSTVTSGDVEVAQGTLGLLQGVTVGGTGTLAVPSGGTLEVGAHGTAINVTRPIALSGGTLTTNSSAGQTAVASPITLAAATTSTFSSPSSSNLVLNGNLSGSGSVTKTGGYSLMLGGDNSGFTGAFTNAQSNVYFTSSTAGSAAAAWAISGSGNQLGIGVAGVVVSLGSLSGTTGEVRNNAGGSSAFAIGALGTDTVYSGTIVNGSGTLGLLKVGSGALTLGGANSFTGGAIVRSGTVIASANAAFGTGSVTLGDGGTGSSNVAVLLSNSVDISNAVAVSSSGSGTATIGTSGAGLVNNPSTFGGTITLNRATTFSSTVTDRLAINGQVTGGVGALTVNGGGRTTLLSASNDFSGDIAITGSGSILQASVNTAGEVIPNSSSVDVGSGTTFQLAGSNGSAETIAALTGSGTVTRAVAGAQTLVIGSGNAGGAFSGVIQNGSGTVALNKIGNGVVSLSGANTYSGGTTVSAGLLRADNTSGSATGSGTVAVASGGTLGGTGTIGGAVIVNGTGRLSPGSDSQIAILTLSGNLTMNDSSSLYVQVEGTSPGTGHDQLVVAGAVTLRHLPKITGTSDSSLDDSDTVVVLDKTSGGAISGVFANAAAAAPANQVTFASDVFTYSYVGGGNDFALTYSAHPTPAVVFASQSISVSEGQGAVEIVVELTVPSTSTVSVDIATSDGTATSDDYAPLNQTVTFAPGETRQSVRIPITQDPKNNGNRAFNVTLSNPVNSVLGPSVSSPVTIVNDDTAVQINVAPIAQNLIINGSFEAPVVTHPSTWDLFPSIPGWTRDVNSGPNFELQKGTYGAPEEGLQYLELDAGVRNVVGPGQIDIYQDITTKPGQTYRLTYFVRARPGTPSGDNRLLVKILSNETVIDERNDTPTSSSVWDAHEIVFEALSSTTRIWFGDGGDADNSVGTFLDDVSVYPVTAVYSGTIKNGLISGNVRNEIPLDPQPSCCGDSCCTGDPTNSDVKIVFEESTGATDAGHLSLVHNSITIQPRPIFVAQYVANDHLSAPSSIDVQLTFNGVTQTAAPKTASASSDNTYVVAAQVASPVTETGRYAYKLVITVHFGEESQTVTIEDKINVVVRGDGPFGFGWHLSMLDELVEVDGGLLWVSGNDDATFFEQLPDGSFRGENDLGSLVATDEGYTYTYAGHVRQFDSDRKLTSITDSADSNRVHTFTYSGDDLVSLDTPEGKSYSFGYSGGKVATVTLDGGGIPVTLSYSGGDLVLAEHPVVAPATTAPKNELTYAGHKVLTHAYEGKTATFSYDSGTGLVNSQSDGADTTSINPLVGAPLASASVLHGPDLKGVREDSLGRVTTVKTNAQLQTTSVTAPDGTTTEYSYDAHGQISSVTDSLGRVTYQLRPADAAEIRRVERPDGSFETYQYEETFRRPTVITDSLGRTTTHVYDPTTGVLLNTIDALGEITTFTYNIDNRLETVTDPLLRTTTYLYDASDRVETIIDPAGLRTTYLYDAFGNVSGVRTPTGADSDAVYNGMRRVVASTVAGAGTTTFIYDANGLLESRTEPTGAVTTYEYDAQARRIATIDPDGNRTTTVYNAVGDVIATIDKLGNRTTSVYDAQGRVEATIDSLGNRTTTIYDADSQVLATIDVLGNRTTNVYDPVTKDLIATIDPLNNRTTYIYDANHRIVATLDPLGNRSTTVYDSESQVLATIDRFGQRTTYLYDDLGRQVATVDVLGNRTTTIYNVAGQVEATLDVLGNRTTAVYDAAGRHIATIDPLNRRTTAVYNAIGQIEATIDPLNQRTTYLYDSYGRQEATVDPLGNRSTAIYDAFGRQEATINALGNRTTTVYDSQSRVLATIDPLGNRTTFVYDTYGRQEATIDALNQRSTVVYDSLGRVEASIDPLNHRSTTVYDSFGRVEASIDPLGRRTTAVYDSLGRIEATIDALNQRATTVYDSYGRVGVTIDALGQATTYAYNAFDQLESTLNAANHRTTFLYDAYGRSLAIIDYEAGRATTVYDAFGRVEASIDRDSQRTTVVYDAIGRQEATIDVFGNRTTTVYDALDRAVATINPLGHRTTSVYDAAGRLIASIDQAGARVTYVYDAASQRIAVVDPVGNRTTSVYDAAGREINRIDPFGVSVTFVYDAIGRLDASIDRLGRTRDFHYDAANQNTGETWIASNGTTVNDRITLTYDAAGNQTLAWNSAGLFTMTYDALNRVVHVDQPANVGMTFTYDALNRRTGVEDSFGGVETSTYDIYDRLTSRQFAQPIDGGPDQELRIDFTYDIENKLTAEYRYSDLTATNLAARTTYSYDAADRLIRIWSQDSSNDTLADFQYAYDSHSRLTSKLEDDVPTTYSYDVTDQLTAENIDGDEQNYSYDANGNRTMSGYSTGADNRLDTDGSWNYAYDAEGNMTGKEAVSGTMAWVYGYDHRNQLVRADRKTNGTDIDFTVEYKYDAWGNRTEKSVDADGPGIFNPEVINFALDGWNPAKRSPIGLENFDIWADLGIDGSLKTRYFRDDRVDGLHARIDGDASDPKTYWYLTDHLGSIRKIIDNTGIVKNSILYDAFGNIIAETDSQYRGRYTWTGREIETELGLQYNRARYYDPAIGRWISKDPLGFAAGDSNLYRYTSNYPTDSRDYSGLWQIDRANGATATATSQKGDSILTLAEKIGLIPDEYPSWLHLPKAIAFANGKMAGDNDVIKNTKDYLKVELSPGQAFKIPNRILAIWYGDVGDTGRSTAYDPYLREFRRLGFDIDSFVDRDQKTVLNAIKQRSNDKFLHGIFVVGHGTATGFGTGGGWFDYNKSKAWIAYKDVQDNISYKLGSVILWVCFGGGKSGKALSSQFGDFVFDGVDRTLFPFIDYSSLSGLFRNGKQGTKSP